MKFRCDWAGVVSPRPALARICALTSNRSSWHFGNNTLFDKRIERGRKWYGEIGYFEILFESRYIYIYNFYSFELVHIQATTHVNVGLCLYDSLILKLAARTSRCGSSCSFWPSRSVRTSRTVQPQVDIWNLKARAFNETSHVEASERAKQHTDVTSVRLLILYCGFPESCKCATVEAVQVHVLTRVLFWKPPWKVSRLLPQVLAVGDFIRFHDSVEVREGGKSKKRFQWFLPPIVSRKRQGLLGGLGWRWQWWTHGRRVQWGERRTESLCQDATTVHLESVAKKDRGM